MNGLLKLAIYKCHQLILHKLYMIPNLSFHFLVHLAYVFGQSFLMSLSICQCALYIDPLILPCIW
jgi:hypothetical protein